METESNSLPNAELRKYIGRAKDLEAAIFTQKKLMSEHKSLLDEQGPTKPQKQKIAQPIQPREAKKSTGAAILIMIWGTFMFACGMILLTYGSIFGGLIAVVVGGLAFAVGVSIIKGNSEATKLYKARHQQYQKDLEQYHSAQKDAEAAFNDAMQDYEVQYNKYIEEKSQVMEKHNEMLDTLVCALEKHYSLNIIFAKYRNFVAISAIDEYLLSGRCDKLEGADGAYNLYELELRQNIIIGQLSAIVDNLEKIKNNQYSLYQELAKANNTVDEILSEVKNVRANTCLTAYFARITALAAVTPRYTISV